MGAVILPDATFGGVPAERVLATIRRGRGGAPFRVCAEDPDPEVLVRCGLIAPTDDPERFLIAPAGRGLVRGRIGERMTLAQADAMVDAVLERMSEPEVIDEIGAVRVRIFGSVMRRCPNPADVDMRIVAPKICDPEEFVNTVHYETVFGGITGWREFMRDSMFVHADKRWCETAIIWENGDPVTDPVICPAKPEDRAVLLREIERNPVAHPVPDDPAHLLLPDEPDCPETPSP